MVDQGSYKAEGLDTVISQQHDLIEIQRDVVRKRKVLETPCGILHRIERENPGKKKARSGQRVRYDKGVN